MGVTVNKSSVKNRTQKETVNSLRKSVVPYNRPNPSAANGSNKFDFLKTKLPSRTISNSPNPSSPSVRDSASKSSSYVPRVANSSYLNQNRPPTSLYNYSPRPSFTFSADLTYSQPSLPNMRPFGSRFGGNIPAQTLTTPNGKRMPLPVYFGPIGKRKHSDNSESQGSAVRRKRMKLDGTFKPQTEESLEIRKEQNEDSVNGTSHSENVSMEISFHTSNTKEVSNSTKDETTTKVAENSSSSIPLAAEASQKPIESKNDTESTRRNRVKISQLVRGEGVKNVAILLKAFGGGEIYSHSISEHIVLVKFDSSDQAKDFVSRFSGKDIRGLAVAAEVIH